MTARQLRNVRQIALRTQKHEEYALDRDSLSFMTALCSKSPRRSRLARQVCARLDPELGRYKLQCQLCQVACESTSCLCICRRSEGVLAGVCKAWRCSTPQDFARLGLLPPGMARILATLCTCDDKDPEFAQSDEQLTRVLDKWTHSSDWMVQSFAHCVRLNR